MQSFPLVLSFQRFACGIRFASSSSESRDGDSAVTLRLIGPNNMTMTLRMERSVRQGFTVFTLSGHTEAEQGCGAEGAFRYGLPKHHSRLARDEAGGS